MHSIVIGAHSRYFQNLLRRNVPPFLILISIHDFSSSAIIEVIRFIYTAQINPSPDNLPELFKIADKWQVEIIFCI